MKQNKPIAILIPKLPKLSQYKKYLRKMDENRVYSNAGPIVTELEERLANYFKVDGWQVVACANATLGLEGAIFSSSATGLKKKDIWSLPSWTFSATAAAVLRSGLTGQFLDVDNNWRVETPKDILNIIDVLPFGDEIDMNRFLNHKGKIIIDAAAAFDSLSSFRINDFTRPLGVLISFHATKSLPGGEGGMFLTNDPEWSSNFRSWTKFGMKFSRESITSGTNAKMSEISACLILASLDQWGEEKQNWLKLNAIVKSMTNKYGLKCHPALEKDFVTPYWIIDLKSKIRKKYLESALSADNIDFRNWWANGCHKMSAYKNFECRSMRNTNKLAAETLGLPFHKYLSDKDFRRIDRAIESSLT
jgi:dTDP-4-amino-4,6-dideoxygalactose transaminase